ncbi:ribosomal protein S18 acetylase RimI-like enzyme [Spinactinospora alkalitolerans]|uniref:Ribosomal protein S18 acetylase RimI-like enzyme n=1 Tax=Spinactinospora alkalitolerans TaxID=687207 RepID=A0A852TZG2_9ACTN|nr:GNAT family N-acetyltransferase [Spinactinospora alkalitolerans]NYE48697.1 ribosomal protein S18 acetylase RimI-like enzyme [Spinactinospora alkalitolerans]
METEIELWELAAPAFLRAVPALMEIYAAAMSPPRDQLPGRRTVMEHHTGLPLFHSVTAVSPDGESAVGFAYGFHGQGGQWWHDVVTHELRLRDEAAVPRWFGDSFEIAEVHVHPDWQGRGVGRGMLLRLTQARAERTAVLSTHTGSTPAHGLYRSCGFADVLPEFYFPGSPEQPFTIMAAPLPLRAPGNRRPAGRSRGWRWTG